MKASKKRASPVHVLTLANTDRENNPDRFPDKEGRLRRAAQNSVLPSFLSQDRDGARFLVFRAAHVNPGLSKQERMVASCHFRIKNQGHLRARMCLL